MTGVGSIAEVAFRSGGSRCAGWIHLPPGDRPHPGVVMLHSTAGVRQLRCYAERGRAYAEQGVATLQFDCRGFGASEGEPRQLYDVRMLAEDLGAAIEFARRHEELDPGRLALWGGSASSVLALDAAARDDGVRAVVCLTPFVPGRETQRSAGTPVMRLATAASADQSGCCSAASRRESRSPGSGARRRSSSAGTPPRGSARCCLPRPGRGLGRPGRARRSAPSGRTGSSFARGCARLTLCGSPPASAARCWSWPAREDQSSARPGPSAELARRAPAACFETFQCGHFDLYAGAKHRCRGGFLRRHLTGPA